MHRLTVWVDKQDWKAFVALAKQRKVKASQLVRVAMATYLEDSNKK